MHTDEILAAVHGKPEVNAYEKNVNDIFSGQVIWSWWGAGFSRYFI